MKENKNIDRLFQERLKDFEASPDEKVWQNIAASLNKDKKKRRILPLWLQYSGIASALILGFFAIKSLDKKEGVGLENPVVNKSIPKKTRSIFIDENKTVEDHNTETVTLTSTTKTTANSNLSSKKPNALSRSNKTQNLTNNHSKTKSAPEQENTVANAIQNKNNTIVNPLNTPEKKTIKNDDLDKNIATTNSKEAVNKTPEETNELEEILKEKTEKKNDLASNNKGKWQVAPTVAPVYLQTNSGGSAIDNQFSNNDKSGETSLSFGLGIQYAVNSKIALRTGINKLVLGYNTNDIIYSPGLTTNSIASINYNNNPDHFIEVKNQASFSTLTAAEKNIQKTENGALNQTMGYYELPMEVSYALLDKKIGVSLIGGFSTLFLNENKISLISSESNVELGEANNLNKVHLSSNFGVGFKYQLIPSIHFHFEPTVKYQWNTFSSNSNNFKPVFLGLYSGVSYRF
ncbi:hypothetical protein [Flavobacterium faecale]|uniref:hypothetical protein n=1 Tax=Flavobacterium faecale TaxID=1355330 RepID=UPI003AB0B441